MVKEECQMRGRKRGALLLAAVLTVMLIGVQSPVQAAGGSDPRFLEGISAPEPGYTEISTAEELYQIRDNTSGYYVLTQDIDLSGYENWSPVRAFSGVLDGQGHVIRNLTITKLGNSAYPYAGLFGVVDGGTIRNLGLEDVDIAMDYAYGSYIGAIAGKLSGESAIENCYSTGSIYADAMSRYNNDIFCAGGLAGWAGETGQSLIRSSYSRTTLTATGRYGSILGGILGTAKGETSGNGGQVLIQNCFNSGAVQIAVNDENSYSVSVFAGGLVGTAQKCTLQIQNSCNRGTVTARERNDGDLESYLSCYAHAGGLVGQNGSASLEIKDCYNSGDVFALEDRTEAYAGGLIGSSNALCTVERSYVSGAVSAESPGDGTSYAGGLEGYNTYAEAAYTDSFVLTGEISAAFANTVCMPGASISNVRVLAPVSGDINNNATGTVTAEEAGRQAAYTAAGWSFDGGTAAWRMKPGSPYPVLSWEPDSLSGRPVLQGQPKVVNLNFPQEGIAPNSGNMLYADVSTLTTDQGEDALGTISYQWMRNDSPIAGATGNTYQIPESGSKSFRYSVRVTASGCAGTAFSEKTMPVEDRLMLLGTVEIDNTDPELLDTLHVDVSGLSVTKGSVEELNLKYEWYLEGDSWKVSTADSYTVRADAVDEAIYVRVTASGAVNYVESAPTQPVRLVDFAGGTGTEGDPYQISNTKEWALFQYRVGYQDHAKYTGAHYELTRDIDFSQAPGNLHISNESGFAGVLDGNGHAIRNMTIQSVASYGEIGLFSWVTEGGVIKNLHLENANFTGGNNVGGLVGLLQDSTLSNCTVSGTLQTTSTSGVMGGLVCRAENSHISDCRNYASLSGSDNTGGIVGEAANCTLERVYNNADISQTGGYGAGGIVGRLGGGSISQAVNRGAVESEKVYNTGGIVGMVQGGSGSENKEVTLDNCTNLGTVRGNYVSMASAGGLIGAADWPGGTVKITNSINSGRVSTGTVGKIGGMVGEIQSETLIVKNCANTGELTFGTAIGKTKYAGGVVGYVMLSNAVLTVENFYTTGFPTAGGDDPNSGSYEKFGRLYGGMQYNIQKTFTNCYSNADPQSHKDDQEKFYTYAPDMQEEAFADTLSANIAGQEGLLAWQLDQEVNGGYPSLAGQGSRILYAGSRGVELSWSGEASAAETDFVLAAYDTEGRLLAVNTMSLAGSLPDQLFFREPVELGTGCTVNVFSLAPESLAPQRAVLTCIIE